MTTSFGTRLAATIDRWGRLCVGIDPHSHLLDRWGLADDANGAREFGLRVVGATAGRAGIVKLQVAFFERFGSAGYSALEDVLTAARSAGLLVIADAKRGDIGSSVDAYTQAWLSPGSPLEADAVTVNPYLGVGALASSAALVTANGKGMFVLAATSNPEAVDLQTAELSRGPHRGVTVAAGIVAEVKRLNETVTRGSDPTLTGSRGGEAGDIGVVIGATVRMVDTGIDPTDLTAAPPMPILAPGFGHQGAKLNQFHGSFGEAARFVVASASRSILSAGPTAIGDVISQHVDALAAGPSVRP